MTRGADGSLNANDPATGQPTRGNIAETFEFRAIDRGLRTPYVQQWNLGFQYEVTKNLPFEARYVGTKGTKLLQALAFNQGFDLNDTSTPDSIFQRFVDSYVAAGSPRGPLNAGSSARERGLGKAFGFPNPLTGQIDLNFSQPVPLVNGQPNLTQRVIIPFEARGVMLGFNIPEALLLRSSGNSIYNGLQLGMSKRMSNGFSSTPPTPSQSRSTRAPLTLARPQAAANRMSQTLASSPRAISEIRSRIARCRISTAPIASRCHSFMIFRPSGTTRDWLTGWQIAGFVQAQSGTPFSIFSSEPEARTLGDLTTLNLGVGGFVPPRLRSAQPKSRAPHLPI